MISPCSRCSLAEAPFFLSSFSPPLLTFTSIGFRTTCSRLATEYLRGPFWWRFRLQITFPCLGNILTSDTWEVGGVILRLRRIRFVFRHVSKAVYFLGEWGVFRFDVPGFMGEILPTHGPNRELG